MSTWDDDETEFGELDAGVVISALSVEVPLVAVPAARVVDGAPQTGSVDLDEDMGLGVWEMTVGAMRDTEVSEVFVVVAGSATVDFIEPALPPIELSPGAIVRLESGMHTVWTVRETLRKVYLASPGLCARPAVERAQRSEYPRLRRRAATRLAAAGRTATSATTSIAVRSAPRTHPAAQRG